MRIQPAIVAIVVGLATTGTATTLAYLTPTEVFPGIDVKEEKSSSSEMVEAEKSAEDEGDAQGQSVNPFEQEQQSASEPAPEQSETVSSIPTQDSGKPTFYRSGEQIQAKPKPEPSSSARTNVFEEPEPQSSVSSAPKQEPEAVPEEPAEEPTEEPEPEEENIQAAAPKQSMLSALLGQIKYILGAVGLGIGGVVLLAMKKKSPGAPDKPATTPDRPNQPEPSGPAAVENSSQRLEHALGNMDEAAPDSDSEDKATPPE